MDFQTIFDGQLAKMKAEEFAKKPIRTLGEVMLLLKMQPSKNIVQLDFTAATPITLDSYRGYYEDLSIDYDEDAKPCSVATLLKWCEGADGRTFTGYKGGDFTMHRKTLMWVAPYGDTGRMLIDIKSKGRATTIITGEDEG